MTKQEQASVCKPLLHHITPSLESLSARRPNHVDAALCHLHSANICRVHGAGSLSPSFRVSHDSNQASNRISVEGSPARVSVACSGSLASPTGDSDYDASQFGLGRDFGTIEGEDEGGFEGDGDGEWRLEGRDECREGDRPGERCSWSAAESEDDLKKACEELCAQMRWTSEKHYQEVARASFREIAQCQAGLHALHEEDVRRRKESLCEECLRGRNGYNVLLRSGSRSVLSVSQSHSPFGDATFGRPFRKSCKERPMSAPVRERMRRITSPGRSLVAEDLLQRYSAGNRVCTPRSGKGGASGIKFKEDVAVLLHPSPSSRNVDCFRSKSAELKKPRFCTGVNRGKGETMPEDAGKKTLKVLPVIALHRDKAKSVWNRKANQKEWHAGHRGCCSQHWVSLLDRNEKICYTEGRKSSSRVNLSPTPKAKSSDMATQKLQVQGEKCRLQVARSLDLSSSPLSNLKTIIDDMNRPQSASFLKSVSDVSTPRSSSACRNSRKPSVAVPLPRKLKTPELNSSAWLLARMEALKNETFTEPKALQIAKQHGIVLDKEDEVALKKFLQSEQSPSPERERNKPREKYFNLSNISTPTESFVAANRKVQKQCDPKVCSMRIRDRPSPSERCPQVFSKPDDLNLKSSNDHLDWSDEERGWIESCGEAHTTTNVYNICHT